MHESADRTTTRRHSRIISGLVSHSSVRIEANRDLFDGRYTALHLQQYNYVYRQNSRSLDRMSVALEMYYRLGGMWCLSLRRFIAIASAVRM